MAENESIGGLKVEITGDYSQLQGDIDSAAQVAQKGGAEIASALSSGAAGADTLSSAVGAATEAVGGFEEQIQALVASGSTLAEALAAVGTAATTAAADTEAAAASEVKFSDAAQALIDKQAKLEAEMGAAAVTLRELYSGYEQGTVSAATLARAQDDLATASAKAGESAQAAAQGEQAEAQATQSVSDSSSQAIPNIQDLGTALLKIAGITASIDALKNFAAETINVYGAAQRAAEGVAFMRGNMAEADSVMQDMRATAQSLALPFDSVAAASQKMQFFKLTADETAVAIRTAADAAKVSGQSFDSLAAALAGIAETGVVMPRTLKQLGITFDDLAEVMQVDADKVKKTFAEMDEGSRLDALVSAMNKTRGASEAMANDVTSNLTRLSNQWKFALQDMGSDIAPLAVDAIPMLVTGFKLVLSTAETLITGFKLVADGVVLVVETALEGVTGLAKVNDDVFSGHFKQAVADASDASNNISAYVKNSWNSIVADGLAGTTVIEKLWADQAAAAQTSTDEQRKAAAAAAAAAAQAAQAALQAAAEMKKEQEAEESFAKSAEVLWNKIPDAYDAYVQRLVEGGQTAKAMLGQVEAEINKAETMMESMRGAPLAAMQEWVDSLKSAQKELQAFAAEDVWAATAQKVALFADKYQSALKDLDAATPDWVNSAMTAARDIPAALDKIKPEELLGKLLEGYQKLDDQTTKLTSHMAEGFDKWENKAQNETIPILATLRQRLMDVDTTVEVIGEKLPLAFRPSTISEYVDMVKAMNAEGMKTVQQYDSEIASAQILLQQMQAMHQPLEQQAQQQQLIYDLQLKQAQAQGDWNKAQAITLSEMKAQLDTANALNEPLGVRLDLQKKIYQQEIETAAASGRDASEEIVALNNLKLAQKALYDQTHAWGDLQAQMTNDVIGGFENMGHSIDKVIVEGGDLGQAFVDVGKQIAEALLDDVVKAGLTAVVDSIVKSVIPTVTSIVPAVSSVTGGITAMQAAMQTATAAMVADIHTLNAAFASLDATINGSSGASSGTAAGAAGGINAGPIGLAASIANAISSIIGNFQMAHLEKLAGEMEVTTRGILNETMNRRKDAWDQSAALLSKLDEIGGSILDGLGALFDRLGDIWTALGAAPGAVAGINDGGRGTHFGNHTPLPPLYGDTSGAASQPYLPSLGPSAIPSGVFVLPVVPSPSVPVASAGGAALAPQSAGATVVNFTIQAAQNPLDTARTVAQALTTISPRFATAAR